MRSRATVCGCLLVVSAAIALFGSTSSALAMSCSDDSFVNSPFKRWPNFRYTYSINYERLAIVFGYYGSRDEAISDIHYAHEIWGRTHADCGFRDQNNVVGSFLSNTANEAGRQDSVNTMDLGDPTNLGCQHGVLACTRLWLSGSSIVEGDIRFAKWPYGDWDQTASGPCPTCYDWTSVASHEVGHLIGLDHVFSNDGLLMYPQIERGQSKRSLGLGDVFGMRTTYPSTQQQASGCSGYCFRDERNRSDVIPWPVL